MHDFDAARWLVGAALSDPGFEEVGDIDNAVIILRFASGALGVIDNSRAAGYGCECSSEILGHRGTLRIENNRRVAVETLTHGRACRDYVSDFVERFADACQGRWSTSPAWCAARWSLNPAESRGWATPETYTREGGANGEV